MENTELKQFETIPESFLTEISENDFLKEVQSTENDAGSIPDAPKIEYNTGDIETHSENISAGAGPVAGPAGGISIINFLNEETAVEIYDSVLTAIAINVLSFVDIEMKKNEVAFTAKEKNTLKPIIKQCLENLNIKFTNPFEALFWTSGILIATKIFTEKGPEIVEKFNTKKPAVKKAETKEKPLSKYMQKKLENAKQNSSNRGKATK